jgi:hypothetical protein
MGTDNIKKGHEVVTTLMQRHKVMVGFLTIPQFEVYGEV